MISVEILSSSTSRIHLHSDSLPYRWIIDILSVHVRWPDLFSYHQSHFDMGNEYHSVECWISRDLLIVHLFDNGTSCYPISVVLGLLLEISFCDMLSLPWCCLLASWVAWTTYLLCWCCLVNAQDITGAAPPNHLIWSKLDHPPRLGSGQA